MWHKPRSFFCAPHQDTGWLKAETFVLFATICLLVKEQHVSQHSTRDAEQPEPLYKAVVLNRIDQTWNRLQQLVRGLDAEQLTAVRDSQGWSVKDHLVHLSAWERSLIALLQGRDRSEALGIGDIDTAEMDVDDKNRIVRQRNEQRSLEDVMATSQQTHQELRAFLGQMSEADVLKPYSHYQPNNPPEEDWPVVGWIAGNTYDHYSDHISWIEGLLKQQ